MTAAPPTARVIRYDGTRAAVRCPYCHAVHEHVIERGANQGRQHRAPGCGMFQPGAVRTTGYTFELPANRPGTTRRERGTREGDHR